MILTSTVTVIIMFCELKQYFRNDGGVTLTLLMSTIAVVIGALISPEELFYGKRICDAIKEILKKYSDSLIRTQYQKRYVLDQ